MNKFMAIASLVVLAACSGNPLQNGGPDDGGGGETPTTSTVPAVLSKSLNAATYNATDQTLTVEMQFDASPFTANYTRNASLDVAGYEAYEVKETSLQRNFIALFKQNARGNLVAGAVSDGGQFNSFFNGGTYSRIDVYTQPTAGLASYAGSYAGLITSDGGVSGAPPIRTTGDAIINADFTSGLVNGAITNRQPTGVTLEDPLVDLALKVTPIASDGTFLGSVEYIGKPNTSAGDFGGLFGGTNASDIAGVLVFNPINYDSKITETGVFVLPCVDTGNTSGVACP